MTERGKKKWETENYDRAREKGSQKKRLKKILVKERQKKETGRKQT